MPFPYMNGPLHIGHAFTALRVDVYARFKRMQGYNTLYPFAWHWTGQPIVAAAERLKNKDPAMEREFIEIDGVPRDQIKNFFDPEYMARYYSENAKRSLKSLGLSVDWRREFHTTDLEPIFNSFVLWQMNKLRSKGYITLGTHPVVWCPRDQSPTGDHDRLEGEGVTWEEFTVILFPLEGEQNLKIAAATLRPETVFAVTNLWINPVAEYFEAEINGKDRWIISPEAVKKLSEQLMTVKVIREMKGAVLIGRNVLNPLDETKKLPILPADFVDPNNGTGVVYSVPAHAPFDYVALRDLQQNEDAVKESGLDIIEIRKIRPIALITIPGYGDFPAVEIVEKMKIKDQKDPKLEEATKQIYKSEFHLGRLNSNAGKFQSKQVSEVKKEIENELKSRNLASKLYDLPQRVICRCLTQCIVKILSDQWFLKYSDPDWKKLAHECVDRAKIYPESAKQWHHDVIDWLRDWPCARRVGLGTPLPWSRGWIVETLSDSTIYTSFYTIDYIIRRNSIGPESLSEELFDFVLLGEGEPSDVGQKSGVDEKVLGEMRKEFLYWYPVDLRNSAKELIPNHLTFYVFQHVAFFPKDLWPAGISANGMMMNEGVKMSKSKGNVITLEHAIEEYGSDALRASLIYGAEGMDDVDWREKTSRDIQRKTESIASFVLSLRQMSRSESRVQKKQIDLWLESQIQRRIGNVIADLDEMKTKSAFQEAFYNFWNDMRHYLERAEMANQEIIDYASVTWLKLLAPFIPFTCDELSSSVGKKELMSLSAFPSVEGARIHEESELEESMILQLSKDAKKIMKILKEKPTTLHVYLPPQWAYSLMVSAIEAKKKNEKMSDLLVKFFETHPAVPKNIVPATAQKIMKNLNDLGESFVEPYLKNSSNVNESEAYKEGWSYLEKELGVTIDIHNYEENVYDPKDRAKSAIPFRPALFFE